MIIKFYRILFGYLRIRFKGDFKERALSLCANNGIILWGTRLTDNTIESSISVKDFKYLKLISRGKGIRVHIVKKMGIPFITERYKKRIGILIGAVLFFAFLSFMSQFIWIIDIEGNNKVTDKQIISACESIGIVEGIRKNSIYPKAEREKLMLKLDGVAWASLNIEGSRLTVNVTETKEKDEEKFMYSNLKATSDGIIEKIDIVSGTSVVNVGQAVKKGDLLVSGIIETADGTRFVKSKGSIIAKSQKEIAFRENFKQKPIIPTGKIRTKYVLEIYKAKIPLYLGQEYGLYETKHKIKPLKLFTEKLPIRIYEKNFIFKRERSITYSYEKLCERLEGELLKEENIKVINKEFKTDKNGVTLTALVEIRENIAIGDILIINAGN